MHACSLLRRRLPPSSANSIKFASDRLLHSGRAQIFPPWYSNQSPLIRSGSFRRPFSTSPLSQPYKPREASSFWSVTFTLFLIGAGAWLQDKYRKSGGDIPTILDSVEPLQESQVPFLGVIETLKTMPMDLPPGTVGNLTPEQEAKLQELWVLLLKVCGVNLDAVELVQKQNGDAAAAAASQPQDKKKQSKRSRFGLFGRSNTDEEEDSASDKGTNGIASSLASISIADGDDKYGQSKEFQQALVDMKPEEIRVTLWNMVKHDNPDSLLLRFLRARKWDVKNALVMLISTLRWRLLDVKLDEDIMKNGEQSALKKSQSSDPAEKKAGEDFLLQMRMGKSFLHGVDKLGRPICVVRVRLHKAADQETEALDRFTVYTIETARMMLAPPVETACVVFDMTDFSLANMDYHPVKYMIKCFEANYPECLGVVLIHKAPWIFSGIWNIIKGWLDPVVASKIQFTKNVQDLEKFIPKDRIMKELEGDENWAYKYVEPQPDENKPQEDSSKRDELLAERQQLAQELQGATIDWISSTMKKDESALKAAVDRRKDLIERLRVQYWQLDPYVRATSLYDRLDVIQGEGKIEFYPTKSKVEGNALNGEKAE
ncbi:CRAL/TRIO domain protein [Aspergillus niger]|uniref:CRAL-TRIO domain-containing protein n=1 Tax=Aspergillus lacticoffeatus (strain CBS 101883) TaxID=1450533 RepID=UPI000D7FA9F6|nr:CRAL/TRIO domain protein [Aspergillus niger CBS 101883]PYH52572.1 CRAL/TRIO domain protein [Aspergillus niger CBS 101883]GJP97187.1 CRAL/TRIO domain protein [Aspergillus niger]